MRTLRRMVWIVVLVIALGLLFPFSYANASETMGSGERPKILRYEARIANFTPKDLIEISNLPVYDQELVHHCVTITA